MQAIRIYEIPKGRMVSSGAAMFGDGKLERFCQWFSAQPSEMFPRDFLFWDDSDPGQTGFHWLYTYREGTEVPEDFEIVDFCGGLYAVATDIDGRTDQEAMRLAVDAFLASNGLVRDGSRRELGNVITSPAARKILGYSQMDYYTPVKPRA